MLPNKLKVPQDAANKLKMLQGRTGLTPNLVCRFALAYSLADDSEPQLPSSLEEGREFNRYTLFGEHERVYEALMVSRYRAVEPAMIVAHLSRGIAQLSVRVKGLTDLLAMAVPREGGRDRLA